MWLMYFLWYIFRIFEIMEEIYVLNDIFGGVVLNWVIVDYCVYVFGGTWEYCGGGWLETVCVYDGDVV